MVETRPVQAEQEMQDGVENPAGVVGGEQGAGFNSNDDQPEGGGDPCFQNIVLCGTQAGKPRPGFAGPDSREPALSLPKGRLSPQKQDSRTLLNRIVRGLAGDHYVVDVAFAQARAADGDEERLLQ
jgi:hypothetical protein